MPLHDLSAIELVRACVGSADPEVWQEFLVRFQPTIAGMALRIAWRWGQASPLVVEDLVQETLVRLCTDNCRLLREFEPPHEAAIYGYLKVVSSRVAKDYFKRLRADKRKPGGATVELQLAGEAEDRRAEHRIERDALVGEIGRRLTRLTRGPAGVRDRRIFWLYYRMGLSARMIADLPGIELTVKGVESTLFRLTRLIRADLAGSGRELELAEESEEVPQIKKGKSAKLRLE